MAKSQVGYVMTTEGSARGVAPFVTNRYDVNQQNLINTMFKGGDPNVRYTMVNDPTEYGPTSAFNTTVQAMIKPIAMRLMIIWHEIHKSQTFAGLLAPLTLAESFRFITKVLTSNLGDVEEAPEHVPATAETNQWYQNETTLTRVQKLVKASQHDLMTPTGLQNFAVSNHNIAVIFNRDFLNEIIQKFMTQGQNLLTTLVSFQHPSQELAVQFMHMTVDMFGILNCDDNSLDRIIEKVNLVAVHNRTSFDTAVVPYNCLNRLALKNDNFRSENVSLQYARSLAETMDLENETVSIPTMVYNNAYKVHKWQRNIDQMQNNSKTDPMTKIAVVATYHVFGNERYYIDGVRDIDIVSGRKLGLQRVTLRSAIQNIDWDLIEKTSGLGLNNYESERKSHVKYAANDEYYDKPLDTYHGPNPKRRKTRKNDDDIDGNLSKLSRDYSISTVEGAAYVEEMLCFWACRRKKYVEATSTTLILHVTEELCTYFSKKGFFAYKADAIWQANEFKFNNNLTHLITLSGEVKELLITYLCMPFNKDEVLQQFDDGLDFPFEMAVVRPFIELETGSLMFCKAGLETATMFHRVPQAWPALDNKSEMYEVKYELWRACHIENPRNICVVDHAYVSRVIRGMHTNMGTQKAYLQDPFAFRDSDKDIYPIILGPRTKNPVYPALAAISHKVLDQEARDNYTSLDKEKIHMLLDGVDINECWGEKMGVDMTLWQGDSIRNGNIPRVMGMGYTQQFQTLYDDTDSDFRLFRIAKCEPLQNTGHLKILDSPKMIKTLNGLGM
jgi:hypothetical protein